MLDITRQINESELDYHKRIIYGKLIDKTLADMDYSELAELVYGKPYSSDVARRMMYGSCKTLGLVDEDRLANVVNDNANILNEIDSKLLELKKERQKFFDQRREYNKIISQEAREEHLCEMLIAAASSISDTVGCMYQPYVVSEQTDTEAILVFSDWHFGLKTHNVFNEYNTEICKERVKKVVDAACERLILHSCNRLHVVVLGDVIHGAIHNSARVASEEYTCDQLMQASEILAQSIERLSSFVSETIVYTTYGNHARTVQNKHDSIHRDNMERLVPWWLSQRFSEHENIIISPEEDTEFIFVNSCGHEFCASHGDNDSVRNSPRLLSVLFHKKYGKDIEYILLGDKHHRESFDELGISSMLCGSLCGTDDYANNKRLYSTPSQLLLIVKPECGVDAEYRLAC